MRPSAAASKRTFTGELIRVSFLKFSERQPPGDPVEVVGGPAAVTAGRLARVGGHQVQGGTGACDLVSSPQRGARPSAAGIDAHDDGSFDVERGTLARAAGDDHPDASSRAGCRA